MQQRGAIPAAPRGAVRSVNRRLKATFLLDEPAARVLVAAMKEVPRIVHQLRRSHTKALS